VRIEQRGNVAIDFQHQCRAYTNDQQDEDEEAAVVLGQLVVVNLRVITKVVPS
jgi:hypothetical protein